MGLLSNFASPPSTTVSPICLFISHSWGYGEHRLGVHNLLNAEWRKGVDYIDLSVPSEHPIHNAETDRALFCQLRDRILKTDVFLVLGGMYATSSVWMEREVNIAAALNVPILAVIPHQQEKVSSIATTLASKRVHWSGASIRNAILEHAPARKAHAVLRRMAARAAMMRAYNLATGPTGPASNLAGRRGPPPSPFADDGHVRGGLLPRRLSRP